MTPFRTPPTPDMRRVGRLRRIAALAIVGAALAMALGTSVPASASPADVSTRTLSDSFVTETPDATAYWGDGDNVAIADYLNTRSEVVATVTGSYEVTEYPAAGVAGTVTVHVRFSTWAVSDYALWNAPNKTTMMIGTQTASALYSARNLSPTEFRETGSSTNVTWSQDRDNAWIKFHVGEDWNREILVQGTGNWYGPDGGQSGEYPSSHWSDDDAGVVWEATTEPLTQVEGVSDIVDVEGNSWAGYGIGRSGEVWAWGNNRYGSLGNGTVSSSYGFGKVLFASDIISISTTEGAALAITSDGNVWSWGWGAYGETGRGTNGVFSTPQVLAGLPPVAEIATTRFTVAARTQSGEVWVWGRQAGPMAGNGGSLTLSLPTRVTGLSDIASIAVGGYGSYDTLYAVDSNGAVWAVGSGFGGALGDGLSSQTAFEPIQVPLVDDVVEVVAAGRAGAYAITSDGDIWAWGLDSGLTNPENPTWIMNTPFKPEIPNDVVDVVADPTNDTGYAIMSDGTVWSWGRGFWGENGNGATNPVQETPRQIAGLTGVAQLATISGTTIAVLKNGNLLGWGLNFFGILDENSSGDKIAVPTAIPSPLGVLDISAFGRTFRVLATGEMLEPEYPPGLGFDGLEVTDWESWFAGWMPGGDPIVPWTYVALGDSFQSGEGTDMYWNSTDTESKNMCHRSPLAYPARLAAHDFFANTDLEFWACKGSIIDSLRTWTPSESAPPWDDPRRKTQDLIVYQANNTNALGRLGPETKAVTLGIGGNDIGFAPTLEDCVLLSIVDEVIPDNLLPVLDLTVSCRSTNMGATAASIDRLRDQGKYSALLSDIGHEAPLSTVYVLGYPRFFPTETSGGRCQHIRWTDQLWINSEIAHLNSVIEDEVAGRANMQYIDIYDVGTGHELCVGEHTNWFMKGLAMTGGSFHPNVRGHALITEAIESQTTVLPSDWKGSIRLHETLSRTLFVSFPTLLRGSVSYPGSDIMVTFISPSGEVFNRTTNQANLSTDQGDTWETIEITEPEVGEWTIELFGLEIDPNGEPFVFTSYIRDVQPEPNEIPVALATLEQHGGIVTVDGSGSYDPDGEIVEIGFDFSDGTVVYGDSATYMYTEPGEVLVTMWVKDDDGDYGFADVGTIIEIPEYEFSGFTRFMSPLPVKEWAQAGHPVYLGFELGKDWGDDIMIPGSPTVREVSCSTGEPIGEPQPATGLRGMVPFLSEWTGEYSWMWDTEGSWAGTCQELTFDFNEGSTASIVIEFSPPGKGSGKAGKDDIGGGPPFTNEEAMERGYWWLVRYA